MGCVSAGFTMGGNAAQRLPISGKRLYTDDVINFPIARTRILEKTGAGRPFA